MTAILDENLYLGIELGSTRIKCCLINGSGNSVATGVYNWNNAYENNFWTYDLNQALFGVGQCYLDLKKKVRLTYGKTITKLSGIGISAMMHGLIALDDNNRLLTPFRTWRNNHTEKVAEELSKSLNFNIPARWSVSHLYYAIKNHEPFVEDIAKITTLSSYVHEKLTNKSYIGKNDASGMFPLSQDGKYNQKFIEIVDAMFLKEECSLKIENVLPKIVSCGQPSGKLTPEGALLLDPEGDLLPGVVFCAPEGDAATGMVSTNSITPRSGNVSAGTSIFGTFVLDKTMAKAYPEIDIVVTPDGKDVAMIHCNNCTSGINQCVELVNETLKEFGIWKNENEVFETLLKNAMNYEGKFSHIACYNYLSGENITKVEDGALLLAVSPTGKLNMQNLMLAQLFASFATFSIGMDILKEEGIDFDNIYVHGGIFKTKGIGQKVFASVINKKISLNEEASEGGPWGMALLSMYNNYSNSMDLGKFLEEKIFKNNKITVEEPQDNLTNMYKEYKESFLNCLNAEKIIGKELSKKC